MAHKEQQQFLLSVKERFPERFQNCSVKVLKAVPCLTYIFGDLKNEKRYSSSSSLSRSLA